MSTCIIPDALPPIPAQAHYVLVCIECGCREVETTAWACIDWLTGEERIRDDEGPSDQAWCPGCDEAGNGGETRTRCCGWDVVHPAEVEVHVYSQQVNA